MPTCKRPIAEVDARIFEYLASRLSKTHDRVLDEGFNPENSQSKEMKEAVFTALSILGKAASN